MQNTDLKTRRRTIVLTMILAAIIIAAAIACGGTVQNTSAETNMEINHLATSQLATSEPTEVEISIAYSFNNGRTKTKLTTLKFPYNPTGCFGDYLDEIKQTFQSLYADSANFYFAYFCYETKSGLIDDENKRNPAMSKWDRVNIVQALFFDRFDITLVVNGADSVVKAGDGDLLSSFSGVYNAHIPAGEKIFGWCATAPNVSTRVADCNIDVVDNIKYGFRYYAVTVKSMYEITLATSSNGGRTMTDVGNIVISLDKNFQGFGQYADQIKNKFASLVSDSDQYVFKCFVGAGGEAIDPGILENPDYRINPRFSEFCISRYNSGVYALFDRGIEVSINTGSKIERELIVSDTEIDLAAKYNSQVVAPEDYIFFGWIAGLNIDDITLDDVKDTYIINYEISYITRYTAIFVPKNLEIDIYISNTQGRTTEKMGFSVIKSVTAEDYRTGKIGDMFTSSIQDMFAERYERFADYVPHSYVYLRQDGMPNALTLEDHDMLNPDFMLIKPNRISSLSFLYYRDRGISVNIPNVGTRFYRIATPDATFDLSTLDDLAREQNTELVNFVGWTYSLDANGDLLKDTIIGYDSMFPIRYFSAVYHDAHLVRFMLDEKLYYQYYSPLDPEAIKFPKELSEFTYNIGALLANKYKFYGWTLTKIGRTEWDQKNVNFPLVSADMLVDKSMDIYAIATFNKGTLSGDDNFQYEDGTGASDPSIWQKIGNFFNGDSLNKTMKIIGTVILCLLLIPFIPLIFRLLFWIVKLPVKLFKAIGRASKKNKRRR